MFVIKDANEGEKIIKNLFTQKTRVNLNKAVNKGYELAIHAQQNTNFLNHSNSRGMDLLAHLKNFAVEYSIIKYIESGLLPYEFNIEYTKNNTSRYFVLFDSNRKFELCVNQVPTKQSIGRKAFYRKQRIDSFNSYFKLDDSDDEEIVTERPIYFELNHGYQTNTPQFIVLGKPGSDGKWIDKVEISKELTVIENTNTIKTKVEDISFDFDFDDLQKYIEKSERDA